MALTYSDDELHRRRAADSRKIARERKASAVDDFKRTLRCLICREREPACLDLHHLDGKTKDFSISEALGRYSLERIMQEMGKCVVLCSNCHRKLHAGILVLA